VSTPKKIHIIGSVGSGKSTLARQLSSRLTIPYFELDNMVWQRVKNGEDIRNSVEVRDAILNDVVTSDEWIIEGVHYRWVLQGFEKADMIIYLDAHIWKRNFRIFKRFVVQKLGFEKGNYKQTFKMLGKMYKWNYNHTYMEKPLILELLQPYQNKLLVLRDNTEIYNHTGLEVNSLLK
jgi:adenylate kinase family enzyme